MPLLVAGFGSVVVRLVIYALFPYAPVIAVTQLLHAFTFGLLHSVSIAYINRRIPVQRRGLGMAVYSSVALGLSVFVGSSLGGFVVEAFGFDGLFLGYAAIPAAAIVILLFQSHRLGLTPAADG
jgi:PPP family 3-phenylpropionic acid transporter